MMKGKSKVIVIGSNSFSGSDFIDLLLEKEEYDVLGVSRSEQKSSVFLHQRLFTSKKYRFRRLDLNHDMEAFGALIEDFRPDYIVNFAAQSEVAPSWENPTDWYQTNVVALTELAHILKDKKFLKRYVHISSPEVYGTCAGIVKEDARFNPSTPYAASKAAGDLSLMTYTKNFGFPLVTVRATNVYGPFQQLFKIIPRSIIYLKKGIKIQLHGGGKAVKSYIHIRDVSRGERLIMEQGKAGEAYHISPDEGIAVCDVVKRICEKMHCDYTASTEMTQERLGQDAAYIIDSSKIRNELGWEPTVSIGEGIEGVVHWINANWKSIAKEPLEYIHKK